jgi:hypothetical protein
MINHRTLLVPIVPEVPGSNVLNGLNSLNILNAIFEPAYFSASRSVAVPLGRAKEEDAIFVKNLSFLLFR